MGESYGVAAFRSRQHVLRMSELLRREGAQNAIVSTPREISAGCGLSVRFDLNDVNLVKRAVDRAQRTNLIGLYRVSREDGQKAKLSALSMRD